MLKQFTVKGNNYECGYQIGKEFSNQIKRRLVIHDATAKNVEKFRKDLEKVHKICSEKYPQYIEEIRGMSEGSGIDYWQLLLMSSPEIAERKEGCTTIAIRNDKESLLAHNEDEDNKEQKKNCALLTVIQKDMTFHSFLYPGELPGSAYNWNSYGLIATVNYVVPLSFNKTGVPRFFVARAVIEAKNPQEAISILRKSDCASGYHHYIIQNEDMFSIEQSCNRLSIVPISGIYAHTNHYVHESFAKKAHASKHSATRLARVKELIQKGKIPLDILFDKKNRPNPIFNRSGDGSRTLSTVVFYPMQNKVLIYEKDSKKKYISMKIN